MDAWRHLAILMAGLAAVVAIPNSASSQNAASEAPTGFDAKTNGFTEQGIPFEQLNADNVVPQRSFNDNRFIFEEVPPMASARPSTPRVVASATRTSPPGAPAR